MRLGDGGTDPLRALADLVAAKGSRLLAPFLLPHPQIHGAASMGRSRGLPSRILRSTGGCCCPRTFEDSSSTKATSCGVESSCGGGGAERGCCGGGTERRHGDGVPPRRRQQQSQGHHHTRTRSLVHARLSKSAVERCSWAKFGDAVNGDDHGSRLTMVSTEEVLLQRHEPQGNKLRNQLPLVIHCLWQVLEVVPFSCFAEPVGKRVTTGPQVAPTSIC